MKLIKYYKTYRVNIRIFYVNFHITQFNLKHDIRKVELSTHATFHRELIH